jgi:glycosyltransferase involved in cell wall biosynthesis
MYIKTHRARYEKIIFDVIYESVDSNETLSAIQKAKELENERRQHADALGKLKEEHEKELENERRQHHAILNSTFWKITKPIRLFMDFIKLMLKFFIVTKYIYKFLVHTKRFGLKMALKNTKRFFLLKRHYRKNKVDDMAKEHRQQADATVKTDRDLLLSQIYRDPKDYGDFVDYKEHNIQIMDDDIKLIAFYLPQFHTFKENDEWWGKGFTEWTNVTKALPHFVGHYQPHLPIDVGFYDLNNISIMERQVELAKNYGIFGFCFHYYWFSGKRLMEKPLDNYLNNPEKLNFPFCICWANESWTRRWDGLENNVLIFQKYLDEDDIECIKDMAKYLQDKRYIRVSGKPIIIIYQVDLLPNPQKTFDIWRNYCIESGIGDLHIVGAKTFEIEDPCKYGCDMAVEFPPHFLSYKVSGESIKSIIGTNTVSLHDMQTYIQQNLKTEQRSLNTYKTVFPSWDNTPRRTSEGAASILQIKPEWYKKWLSYVCKITLKERKIKERYVFINAWNEWAEGAHLEPDRRFGYAYLEATAKVIESTRLKPLVSIVVPMYNHELFIERCLWSIANQDYPKKELILIDDCSEDDTINKAREFLKQKNIKGCFENIKIIVHTENQGASHTLNEGVNISDGYYIAIINSDDMFESNRLTEMINELIINDGSIAFSNIKIIDNNDRAYPRRKQPITEKKSDFFYNVHDSINNYDYISHALIYQNVAISTGNFVFSKELFNQLGGFNDYKYIHDWDFILRASLYAEPVYVRNTAYLYRLHSANTFSKLDEQGSGDREGPAVMGYMYEKVMNNSYTNKIIDIKKDIYISYFKSRI